MFQVAVWGRSVVCDTPSFIAVASGHRMSIITSAVCILSNFAVSSSKKYWVACVSIKVHGQRGFPTTLRGVWVIGYF